MKVLYLHPPNFAATNRAFNVRGKRVIFAFGSTIYNPRRITIPPELYAHEAVHQERQGADPMGWWDFYISDPQFRLQEEIPAHQAEYREVCTRGSDPGWRQLAAERIAARLASPLYGSLVGFDDAIRLVRW